MPIRNALKSAGMDSYAVPSLKLQRMVHCKGWIERDFAYLLEYDPLVVSYEEQPCKISYTVEQKMRFYIPDFAVHWHHQQSGLVECGPTSRLNDPENLRRWTAARLWCEQNGYTFMLVTDTALRACSTFLSNIKLLAGHAHQRITLQARDYLLKAAQAENRALSVAELVERTSLLDPRIARSYIWYLLFTGELSTDLTKPLNTITTLIWFPLK